MLRGWEFISEHPLLVYRPQAAKPSDLLHDLFSVILKREIIKD